MEEEQGRRGPPIQFASIQGKQFSKNNTTLPKTPPRKKKIYTNRIRMKVLPLQAWIVCGFTVETEAFDEELDKASAAIKKRDVKWAMMPRIIEQAPRENAEINNGGS